MNESIQHETKRGEGIGRFLWNAPFRTLAALAAAATAASFLARAAWPLELLCHFRVAYALAGAACLVGLAVGRSIRWAALAAAVLLVNGVAVAPYLPRGAADAPGEVKLLVANVFTANPHHDRLLALIERADPDVVALMEVDAAWARALESLHGRYRYRLVHPRQDNFGIALYSRLPVEDLRIERLGEMALPTIVGRLAWPGAAPRVPLVFTHPLPPIGARRAAARNDQLEAVGRALAGMPRPLILAGDLNATPWSPACRDLVEAADLRQPRRGRGVLGTWPSTWPAPLRLPVDHVMVGGGIEVTAFSVGPDIGSDHRPIIAALSLAGG